MCRLSRWHGRRTSLSGQDWCVAESFSGVPGHLSKVAARPSRSALALVWGNESQASFEPPISLFDRRAASPRPDLDGTSQLRAVIVSHIHSCRRFAAFLKRSPDTATAVRKCHLIGSYRGWGPGRVPARGRGERILRRLGGRIGRRLSAALQHQRLERRTTVKGLHPAHPGRSSFIASKRISSRYAGSGTSAPIALSPYPGARPRLRAVEEPGDVAEPRWSRKLAAHRARRTRAHSIARRRIAER